MRIAFGSFGSLGDLHPVLALACGAAGRGHEVVVAAAEAHRGVVEAAGVDFLPLRPGVPTDEASLAHYFHMSRGPVRLMRELSFAHVRETHEDLARVARGADVLVVGELLYTAPQVAAAEGIPWANLVLAPTSFLSSEDPCVLAPAPFLHPFRRLGPWFHRLAHRFGRLQTAWHARPLTRFQRSLGVRHPGNPVYDSKHSPHLVLTLFPDFLAPPQRDWPPAVRQCGFVFHKQPVSLDPALRSFLDRVESPVVFTLGSIVAHFEPCFYDHAVEAARIAGVRALILTGRNPRKPAGGADIHVADYAPLEEVLPSALAVVHAGGIGTCGEVLRAGVPSIVVPYAFDQPDNAFRMRRLGVAGVLPRGGGGARAMARALRRVIDDPRHRARARHFSAVIDPARSLACALDGIEGLAGRG
jgi:rhamnosyltransferase subunit B